MTEKTDNIIYAIFNLFFMAGITTGGALLYFLKRELLNGILFSVIALIFMLIIYWITNPYKIIIIKKEETNEEHRMSI